MPAGEGLVMHVDLARELQGDLRPVDAPRSELDWTHKFL